MRRWKTRCSQLAILAVASTLTGCAAGPAAAPPQQTHAERPAPDTGAEALVRTRALLAALDPDDPDRPEIMHQLAFLLEEEANDLQRRAWSLEEAAEPQLTQIDELKARSKGALAEALEIYTALVEGHPGYERVDDARYAAASILLQLGQRVEAARAMQALIDCCPSSPMRHQALLARGEHYFNENNILKAAELYRAAIDAAPTSSLAPFARYKLAWCHFNLNEAPAAWGLFLQIAKSARATPEDRQAVQLAREASKDAVMAYAQFGDPAKALAAFEELTGDPPGAQKLADNLVIIYLDMGKSGEAEVLARALLALPRARSANLSTLLALVEVQSARGRDAETLSAIQDALDAASAPNQADAGWPQAVEDAMAQVEPRLWGLVEHFESTRAPAAAPGRREALELYLKHFPTGRHADRARALVNSP